MFDKLTNKYLIPDSDGRLVFFPCGSIGKGYVINSKEQETKVRQFMSGQWIILFLFLVLVWSLKLVLICLPLYILQFIIWKNRLL